jgi:hypothetical protein
MALRDEVLKRGMKLMEDPRAQKLMQDERVMKVATQAFQLRGKVQDEIDQRVEKVAKSLGLVTKNDVRDLKRTIKKLETEIEKQKKAAK